MSHRQDLRDGVRIGRAEFRRSLRRQFGTTRQTIGLVIAVLFFGGNLLFLLPTAFLLGRTAETVAAIPYVGTAATLAPVGLLVLAALRTLERIGRTDTEALLLTTVHHRAVIIGLVIAELGRLAAWFALPLAAVLGAFTLGLGAASLPITVALIVVPLACWASVWGYAIGLLVLRSLRRLPTMRRLLKIVGVTAMVVLFVGSQFAGVVFAERDVSLQGLLDTLTLEPLADYVALALVGTRLAEPVTLGAVGVLVLFVATTPVGLALATRQAGSLWFTDAAAGTDDTPTATSSGGFTPPAPFATGQAGSVAWSILTRAARNPAERNHLLFALFFIAPLSTTLLQSGDSAIGPLVAGCAIAGGAYLAGATFGLNPLGEDRPQLPLLVLTPIPRRTLVRGRVIAGLAVGLPIATAGPIATLALGTPPIAAFGLAAVGAAMCAAAALFAVGLGAAYPVYEEREFWGTETVVPSTLVMMTYVFVVGPGAAIGLLSAWLLGTGTLAVTSLLVVAVGGYLLVTVGVSYGSYRYATRRYRRYTVD